MRMSRTLFGLLIAGVLLPGVLLGATTGKITGIVTDAETGGPLPGVNVLVEGTNLGAATNTEGRYTILNIPAGTYSMRFTYIGYAEHRVTDIRVEVDLTTTIHVELQAEALQGEAVTVVASRPVVRKDVAASQRSISAQEVESLPISDLGAAIGLQAGVTSGFSIRGGNPNESIVMVDGVTLRNERDNTPITGIPLSALQDISVQTGGFGAEYNNVRSGVVNVVTREGAKSGYSGSITYKYRPAGPKNFGTSPYDPNSFWLRPKMDPAVAWTGTENGAWDKYTQRQYYQFKGWNWYSEQTLQDDNPENDLTPEAAQRIFMWEHRKQGDIKKPDINIDGGFGGPVPYIGDQLGDLRFYASFRNDRQMYLYETARDAVTDRSGMLKLTSDITQNVKLSMLGFYGETYATSYGAGNYMSPVWNAADAISIASFTIPWRLYTNIYWSPTSEFTDTESAKLTHTLSSDTYYEIQLKRTAKEYFTRPGAPRDTTMYEIFPGYYQNEAPFGYVGDSTVYGIDGLGMGGSVSTQRDFSELTTSSAKFDMVSQVNPSHQLKTGIEVVYNDFDMRFGSVNKVLPEGNTWTVVNRQPYRANIYLQDKLEYQGFVASLGVIMDYRNPNGDWYGITDPYAAFYTEEYDETQEYPEQKAEPRANFSPRLAVSHPITENSKLYFNYGHYLQMPTSERLYRIQRDNRGKVDYIGNPLVDLPMTISYELGYDHALSNSILLHLSAYYKDIKDQASWINYVGAQGKVNYRTLGSQNYEDIRGFEVELRRLRGDWITGNINYEYRVNTSGYFGVLRYNENPSDQREYLRQNPPEAFQNNPKPRPRFKSNLNFHTSPVFDRNTPFGGWNMNFMAEWIAGYWMTWNPNNITGITQNIQRAPYYNVDLQLSRFVEFEAFTIKLFVDLRNAFNFKHFSWISFFDAHDRDYYMKSLHLPEDDVSNLGEYGNIPGDDQPGDYRAAGAEFQPMEYTESIADVQNPNSRAIYYEAETDRYMTHENGYWAEVNGDRIDKVLEDKAYIDMPNQSFFTFLNPRSVFFGITFSFKF